MYALALDSYNNRDKDCPENGYKEVQLSISEYHDESAFRSNSFHTSYYKKPIMVSHLQFRERLHRSYLKTSIGLDEAR